MGTSRTTWQGLAAGEKSVGKAWPKNGRASVADADVEKHGVNPNALSKNAPASVRNPATNGRPFRKTIV